MIANSIARRPERHYRPPRKQVASRRGIVEHRVKSWPRFFKLILSGEKTHELRRADDRDFREGDVLRLQEFDPITKRYTGRELKVKITYITSAEQPCALSEGALHPEFCILSIKKLRAADAHPK